MAHGVRCAGVIGAPAPGGEKLRLGAAGRVTQAMLLLLARQRGALAATGAHAWANISTC